MATSLAAAGRSSTGATRRVVLAVLALAMLNLSLSFTNWWPTPGILPDYRLAPEFVVLWLGLLAAVGWRGPPSPRTLAAVSLALLLLLFGRYADVTIPGLFGREVNLYWDGQQLPRFLWVSAREQPWWLTACVLAAALALLGALYTLLRWAVGRVAGVAVPYALRARWTWIPTIAAVAVVVVHLAGTAPSVTWYLVANPITPSYWRQGELLATAFTPKRLAEVLPPSPALEAAMAQPPEVALGGLRGRDFKLLFLESYGAIVYDNGLVAHRLAPSREQLASDIAASGRLVASAFVRSPTFAGGSDLAHMSLLSGIDLADPMRHHLLLTTDRPTLISLFRRAGYQSVGLYPALSWDWPERAFYGFDLFIEGRDLDYRGPPLGHWKIPDQFSLARFDELHPLRPESQPRFLFFPTITTHWPFAPVPPYQRDWRRLLTPDPFGADASQQLRDTRLDWIDKLPGYVDMFEYTYRWLGGYLRRPEARESVMLWVGDHQPASSVTGEGASWDVPVHLITRDPDLLARFVALGFRPGLDPQRPTLGGLHELTALLLEAFDGRPAVPIAQHERTALASSPLPRSAKPNGPGP
jgi:hypothetical protein